MKGVLKVMQSAIDTLNGHGCPLSKQAHLNNGYEEAYLLRIFVKKPSEGMA